MGLGRHVFVHVKERVTARREQKYLPPLRSSGNFFLVEFPKSGVTWLSVLLANAFLIRDGKTSKATFASVRNYVPDINVSNSTIAYEFSTGGVRFYKSHCEFNRGYIHTIYLVRHPFDVMRSFYRYRVALAGYSLHFEKFLWSKKFGIERWRRHINSWLANGRNSNQRFLHLARYEDLLNRPVDALQLISDNFGWGLQDDHLRQAVSASEREVMITQEELYCQSNPNHKMKFVGSGNIGPDDAELRDEVAKRCALELELLGYGS